MQEISHGLAITPLPFIYWSIEVVWYPCMCNMHQYPSTQATKIIHDIYVMFWTAYTTIFIINDCNRTVWVSPRGIYGDTIIDSSCRKDSKNHIYCTNIFL